MMDWIRGQLWEIERSTSLRLFGGFLALSHTLTFFYWQYLGQLPLKYYSSPPLCWTVIDNCMALRIVPAGVFSALYYFYLFFSLASAILFFFSRWTTVCWWSLFILVLLKAFFYLQDLRLSSNTHYMFFCLQFIYLFIPGKEITLRSFIISFYLALGIIKLSPEWLTGQWFFQHKIVRVKFAEWLAALSILVEMIGSVALLYRRGRYFLIALAALTSYHLMLWWLDDFFSSLMYLLALSLFVLIYFEERKVETEYVYQSYLRPDPSPIWLFLVVGCFWSAQLIPRFFQGQSHLRFLSMVAIDRSASNQDCRLTAFAKFDDHTEQISIPGPVGRPVQQQCNTYLRFLDVKQSCRELENQNGFQKLAAYFEIRGLNDAEFGRVFEIEDFCKKETTYKELGLVSWNTIRTDK